MSDYYDDITISLTINGSVSRQLRIHRVGVHIEEFAQGEGPSELQHGTQVGTLIDYSDGNLYRIYASYYIPDHGTEAPYGLCVVYTWKDGSTATEVITEPCNDPNPFIDFSNGVFFFGENAACSDFLLYSAPNSANAPVKVNVTVLKDDPMKDDKFGGVFFGSGAGVTWIAGQ